MQRISNEFIKTVAFKIYYFDSSVYSALNTIEAWNDAPKNGVAIVVLYEETVDAIGRSTRVISGGNLYYCYSNGTLFSTNIVEETTGIVFYFDTSITDIQYENILWAVMEDYSHE